MKYAFSLSDEQQVVQTLSLSGKSIAVNAGAGSGKTHTTRAVGKNFQGEVHDVQHSAKGSANAIEAYNGFANFNGLNFHKRGNRLCNGAEVDTGKVFSIAQKIDPENAGAIANLCTRFKNEGIKVYDKALSPEEVAKKYSIAEKFVAPAMDCLNQSDKDTKTIDLDDMLRMPILLGKKSILSGLVILDEVQDYNPLAWAFLKNCLVTPETQVLMVGDPSRQCLMSFVGANPRLFDEMAEFFNCERLAMNENRRCSQSVVNNAPFKGDMRALVNAPQGETGTKSLSETLDAIYSGSHANDAVISEANAPLIDIGLACLTKGIKVQMRAERLSKMIVRHAFRFLDTRKFQVGTIANAMRTEDAENAQDDSSEPDNRNDVINAIEALETFCLANQIVKPTFQRIGAKFKPVHPIQQALNQLISSNEGLTLLTGHTAKGMEWNTVFHLTGKVKTPEQDWQEHQANCLQHVIATRARLNHYKLMA